MREHQRFGRALEAHVVIPGHLVPPLHMKPHGIWGRLPLFPIPHDVLQRATAGAGNGFAQFERGTGRCVELVHVMRLMDGEAEVCAQRCRRLLGEHAQNGDTLAHVAIVNDGDHGGGGLQDLELAVIESADPGDERNAGARSRLGSGHGTGGQAGVDENIGRGGKSGNVRRQYRARGKPFPVAIGRPAPDACKLEIAVGADGCGNGLPHPACARYRDPQHFFAATRGFLSGRTGHYWPMLSKKRLTLSSQPPARGLCLLPPDFRDFSKASSRDFCSAVRLTGVSTCT